MRLAWPLVAIWFLLTLADAWMLVGDGRWIARSDFASFYVAAGGTVAQAPPLPNLNPPTFTYLIAPLTWVSLPIAFAIWTVLSALALTASLRRIARDVPVSRWLLLSLIGTVPCFAVFLAGQVSWFLLYLIVRAWQAETPIQSGLWLAPAIALKPPLALIALALPWSITMFAGAGSLALTLSVLALTGLQPWRDWLAQSSSVTWLDGPWNVSAFGAAARLTGVTSVSGFSALAWAIVLALVVPIFVLTRRTSGDRRWLCAIWWSVLASPAGWIYYLPLALGPLLHLWRSTPFTITAWVAFALPPILTTIAQFYTGTIVVWLYSAAFGVLWWALCRSPSAASSSP